MRGRGNERASGGGGSTGGRPYGTMELCLASGLEHFGTLKNLGMFGFDYQNYWVSRPVRQRMVEHWPRLERRQELHNIVLNGSLRLIERGLKATVRHGWLSQESFLFFEALLSTPAFLL